MNKKLFFGTSAVLSLLATAILSFQVYERTHLDVPNQHVMELDGIEAVESAFSAQKPIFLKFGADFCPPCRAMEANMKAVAPWHCGDVILATVDIVEQPELAYVLADEIGLELNAIPKLVVLSPGQDSAYAPALIQGGFVRSIPGLEWELLKLGHFSPLYYLLSAVVLFGVGIFCMFRFRSLSVVA